MMNFDNIRVDHLAGYGFSPEVIDAWQTAGLQTLLPLQAQAVMTTGFLKATNLLALGPTSAGKTFIGELAAVRQWDFGRKTIFLSPTRALVAEQYRHLAARYGSLGIRVAMATADHTGHDVLIRQGHFDFGVMVYEKLRSFLIACPDLAYQLGTVVADELQILGEADRGETADLLLTRLTRAEPRVQVIGLSAVVDNGNQLARWLDADLVTSTTRPCELREGVYCLEHARFHYRTDAKIDWQDEVLFSSDSPPAGIQELAAPGVLELCANLARRGESCLLFVPTRAMSRQFSKALASELGIPSDGKSDATPWAMLSEAEDSCAKRQLMECVPTGVAFHNSDLTADLRTAVEDAFNAGHLKILVATPTLAQGVNLKAQNVIQVPTMLRTEGAMQRSGSFIPISVGRYRNQAGRAGRTGSGVDFGRSIIMTSTHSDAVRMMRNYVQASPEPVRRTFSTHSLEQFTLECAHSGLAETYTGIHKALEHTFAWHSGAVQPGNKLEDELGEAVRDLLDLQLIDETSSHRLRLTGSGQTMAAGGFQSGTMRELMTFARDWAGTAPGTFEILCACAFTADGEAFPLSCSPAEMKANVWQRAARKCMEDDGGMRSEELRRLMEPAGGLSLAGHSSLKKAVIVYGWISSASTAELEERFHVVAGTIGSLATHLAWIAGGLGACAAVLEAGDRATNGITSVTARMQKGLCEMAGGLAGLQVAGLTRFYLNRLATEGFVSIGDLKSAVSSEPGLKHLLPAALHDRLILQLDSSKESTGPSELSRGNDTVPDSIYYKTEPLPGGLLVAETLQNVFEPRAGYDLEIDSRDPGFVRFHGKGIRLSPKPYALIVLLAQRCGQTVSYREIDEIIWPEEKVEPQQVSAHKSTLIRELARVSSRELAEAAVVTEARFGLRLDLYRERVCLKRRANCADSQGRTISNMPVPGTASMATGTMTTSTITAPQ